MPAAEVRTTRIRQRISIVQPCGINLTKIESRPTGKGIGNYIFLLDFEGHVDEEPVQEAISELQNYTATFKVLGTYPVAHGLSVS